MDELELSGVIRGKKKRTIVTTANSRPGLALAVISYKTVLLGGGIERMLYIRPAEVA